MYAYKLPMWPLCVTVVEGKGLAVDVPDAVATDTDRCVFHML